MYLHKTPAPISGTATPERSAKNTKNSPASKATGSSPASQVVKPSLQSSTAPPRPPAAQLSATALAAAAGLPSDKLSASIISFARFFSLPLKPELLAAIRRQAQMPAPSKAAQSAALPVASHVSHPNLAKTAAGVFIDTNAAANREALSLAAAAAESKGVKLNVEGLAAYAAAIDPDSRERNSQGRGGRKRQDESPAESEKEKGSRTVSVGSETSAGGEAPLSCFDIKETILESAEKDPLLAVLNRLPGKDGRRWIVFPFTYTGCGREFSISMRVLLEGDTPQTIRACQMVLDVAEVVSASAVSVENGETGKRFIFVTESANGADPKIAVYLQSRSSEGEFSQNKVVDDSPQALAEYACELSRCMDIPLDCITVKNSGENFPFEYGCDNCGDELLRSINEVV